MPNAIAIIKRDHRAVKTDYKRFQKARTEAEKKNIAENIFDALTAHAQMEEEIFYPAVREEGSAKIREHLEEALAEHAGMKELIERYRGETEELGLGMKIDALIAGVLHHVKEEEKELLPHVSKSLPKKRLTELGEEMEPLSPSSGQT